MKERIEELIDQALKSEPAFKLRKDFNDRVVKAISKREKASQRKLYLWMALGTAVIIGFGIGIIALYIPTMVDYFQNVEGGMDQVVPVAVMIGLVVLIVQYLDKRLVKDKLSPNF